MAIDLSAWLDEHSGQHSIWYVKRLSANDTGANGAHQGGPYIATEFLFQIFPQIHTTGRKNPDVWFDLYVDSHAFHCKARAVYYNNKFFDGTRNEARLTNFGGQACVLLDADSTGSLSVFAFHLDGNGAATDCHVWVCDQPADEDLVEERVGVVEPGRHIVCGGSPVQAVRNSCWMEPSQMPPEWLRAFPSGAEIVRKVVELRPLANRPPDIRLLKRSECEFELFRSIEQALELPRIHAGFDSISAFVSHAQSLLQRRKSRAGRSLELHVQEIFLEDGLIAGRNFSAQARTEGNKCPDFLFPSQAAYCDASFPADKLRMLAVKTTCKDRWRQVLNEADRIPQKHLLTLQEGVSEAQFREMTSAGVQLVVPEQRKRAFPASVQPHLQSLESFIADVRLLAMQG